ncbi:Recombinase [Bacillus mycoides]|nr:Recombinase [Bacillus mycoides]
MPLLDTVKYQDSHGNLISDFFLQRLSWLAEEECTKIKQRQKEEIDLAKAQGKYMDRLKTKIREVFISAYNEWG